MVDEYDPNQFRSVESEEEEEEELRRQSQSGKVDQKDSAPSFATVAARETSHYTPQPPPVLPLQFATAPFTPQQPDDDEEAYSDDYSDLSDSCDDLEIHLLKEDAAIPDRAMQSRYQGFAERMDLSEKTRGRMRDRKDFATTQHVLDRRTQTILFTMMQQQLFHTINGCVSSGKEANVYHAVGDSKTLARVNLAVKVYMTSTTSFRDRAQYVSGDFRMRHQAPHRRSTYAMVRFWAEKEFRNLSRIHNCGKILAPRPVRVKGVVLVMEFVGDDEGNAAPRLKDALVEEEEEWAEMYWEVVRQMRVLFQDCGLVHGDLNEYNMLVHQSRPWIIDVSQSVMHEKNPNALLFLRKDVANVTSFFRGLGVFTLTVRELFDFIVSCDGEDDVGRLQRARSMAEDRPDEWSWEEAGAFLEEHIPGNLAEVDRPARDIRAVRTGKATAEDLPYAGMAGLQTEDFLSLKAKRRLEIKREKEKKKEEKEKEEEDAKEEAEEGEEKREEEGEKEEGSEEEGEEGQSRFVHPTRPKNESASSRRQRKAEVKAAQREHRVTKKEERVKWEKKERSKQIRQPKFTRLL